MGCGKSQQLLHMMRDVRRQGNTFVRLRNRFVQLAALKIDFGERVNVVRAGGVQFHGTQGVPERIIKITVATPLCPGQKIVRGKFPSFCSVP